MSEPVLIDSQAAALWNALGYVGSSDRDRVLREVSPVVARMVAEAWGEGKAAERRGSRRNAFGETNAETNPYRPKP